MLFYLGTHRVVHACHFDRAFISVNRLRERVSPFSVNDWILDSGAFTELARFGSYKTSVEDYATLINRWVWCGNLELAVTQDYMCEPFMLQKTGLTVEDHQQLTIERYDELRRLAAAEVMPVLQGYAPEDYVRHLKMYGKRLGRGQRVGVGSVCKRNRDPLTIARVLEGIKNERPDLRLHGFGVKTTALANAYVCSLLYSADSMAWSYAARRQGGDRNGLSEALSFVNKVEQEMASKPHQLTLLETK